jgi:hypothetical protein
VTTTNVRSDEARDQSKQLIKVGGFRLKRLQGRRVALRNRRRCNRAHSPKISVSYPLPRKPSFITLPAHPLLSQLAIRCCRFACSHKIIEKSKPYLPVYVTLLQNFVISAVETGCTRAWTKAHHRSGIAGRDAANSSCSGAYILLTQDGRKSDRITTPDQRMKWRTGAFDETLRAQT